MTGNLLRSGTPFGTHDTHGWPTFAGWPVHDTNTHQQTYYMWLKRAWKAGSGSSSRRRSRTRRSASSSRSARIRATRRATIKLEIRRLKGLERYVDAQSGGPGKGWFRIVRGPARPGG